jgi:hypothetical protein
MFLFTSRQVCQALITYAVQHKMMGYGVYDATADALVDNPLTVKLRVWKSNTKPLRWYWPW